MNEEIERRRKMFHWFIDGSGLLGGDMLGGVVGDMLNGDLFD